MSRQLTARLAADARSKVRDSANGHLRACGFPMSRTRINANLQFAKQQSIKGVSTGRGSGS